ncbi:hypothetical protein [Halosimplex rubrum]|nr:hypothetical protein [Halosimplex rubrum]
MDLSPPPRLLAFLKHEMEEIKNDPDRSLEDRNHASSVLGKVNGEIEWEKEQNRNEVTPENEPVPQ